MSEVKKSKPVGPIPWNHLGLISRWYQNVMVTPWDESMESNSKDQQRVECVHQPDDLDSVVYSK